jgi:hypothetical protein
MFCWYRCQPLNEELETCAGRNLTPQRVDSQGQKYRTQPSIMVLILHATAPLHHVARITKVFGRGIPTTMTPTQLTMDMGTEMMDIMMNVWTRKQQAEIHAVCCLLGHLLQLSLFRQSSLRIQQNMPS